MAARMGVPGRAACTLGGQHTVDSPGNRAGQAADRAPCNRLLWVLRVLVHRAVVPRAQVLLVPPPSVRSPRRTPQTDRTHHPRGKALCGRIHPVLHADHGTERSAPGQVAENLPQGALRAQAFRSRACQRTQHAISGRHDGSDFPERARCADDDDDSDALLCMVPVRRNASLGVHRGSRADVARDAVPPLPLRGGRCRRPLDRRRLLCRVHSHPTTER